MKASKPETMWMVKTPSEEFRTSTLSYSRKSAIDKYMEVWDKGWRFWYNRGFRCVKVEVTIKEVEK